MYYYGFSLKCNRKGEGEDVAAISCVANLTFGSIHIQKISFEKDSKGKLHAHGELSFEAPITYKDYHHFGWHVYIRRIYEHTGWYRYMVKDQMDHDENLFIDAKGSQHKKV